MSHPTSGPDRSAREERVRWLAFDEELGVELLWAEDSPRLWRVYHETYTICTLLSAPSEWTYRGKHLRTANGELMTMEPGEVHDTRRLLAGVSTFRVALVSPSTVERAACELGRGSAPHLGGGHLVNPDVFRAFTRLHRSAEKSSSRLERESRLAECLEHLFQACAEQPLRITVGDERTGVRRARDILEDRCHESVRLNELAAACGLSRSHFLRAFSREVGLPPHAYQLRVRVERARELLVRGMRVVDVAARLGFADQSHLTRQFKQVLGVTPARYLAQRTGRAG